MEGVSGDGRGESESEQGKDGRKQRGGRGEGGQVKQPWDKVKTCLRGGFRMESTARKVRKWKDETYTDSSSGLSEIQRASKCTRSSLSIYSATKRLRNL